MNVDKELVAHILKTGDLKSVLKAGIREEHVKDQGGIWFKEIRGYWKRYHKVPSIQDFCKIVEEDEEDVIEGGNHPLQFYLDKLEGREIELLIREKAEAINQAVLNNRPMEALQMFRQVSKQAGRIFDRIGNVETMASLSDQRMALYDAAAETEDGVLGYRLPWDALNVACGGHMPSDYVVIVAKPGMGKSFCFIECVKAALGQKMKALVISMEMPNTALSRRLLCQSGGFDLDLYRKGQLLPHEYERLLKYEKRLNKKKKPYLVFAPQGQVKTADDIALLVDEHQPDITFIDSFYKLGPSSGGYQQKGNEKIATVSANLRDLALETHHLVIGTHQFSAEQERFQTDAELDNVALSKQIGWDATHVYSLTADKMMFRNNKRKISALKIRDGKLTAVMSNWDVGRNDYSQIEEVSVYGKRKVKVG